MSEVRLVVAILVPAIFTLILKDFFDLFMTNRYEGKVKQYTIWMLYFLLDTVISMNFKFVGVISMLYSFIILIAFCAVLYRDDIKYITLTVLFIICIGAASELIVALGIRAFLNSSQLQQFSLFGSTCSKLIILIIVRIVKLFRVSGIKRLDYMNWLAKSINKLLMKYQDERDLDFTVDLFNDGSGLKSSILSCGSRVHIVLKGKLYKFYKKLDDVEKEISVNYSIPFIRIHKSYLVNFQQIRKVGYTEVETKDGRILKISDTYKKDVRARYSKLLWDGDV